MSKNNKDIETNKVNQVIERIKKALEMKKPSKKEILAYLYTLQANYSLSNFEFFDVIGKIYKLNPKFFMISIYPEIRVKFSKNYGDEGLRVMDKHILERFSLNWEEKIIYELNGKISQIVPDKYRIGVKGTIYITNQKIIAQGKFRFLYLKTPHLLTPTLFQKRSWLGPQRTKEKQTFLMSSVTCYGYTFPINGIHRLDMDNRKLSYFSYKNRIKIIPSNIEDHGDKLFAFLYDIQNRKKLEKKEEEHEEDFFTKVKNYKMKPLEEFEGKYKKPSKQE